MQQLLFPIDEKIETEQEIIRLKESMEKMRKSQFGKIGKLTKQYNDLNERFEILTAAICKGTLPI